MQARTALEQAIALDPKFAAAYALLAEICRSEWWYGWRDDEQALDRALELARKGVALDDELPFAHMFLGWIHLWRKEHEQAITEARRCLELDPDNAEGHGRLGHILDQAGRPEEGVSDQNPSEVVGRDGDRPVAQLPNDAGRREAAEVSPKVNLRHTEEVSYGLRLHAGCAPERKGAQKSLVSWPYQL